MFLTHDKKIKPLPFPIYFWPVALLAVGAFLDAVYLSISHYRVYTDIFYKSFCAISRTFNCDTVSQSPYSILLGMPVPLWGVFAYVFFIFLLFFFGRRNTDPPTRIWSLLFVISSGFSLYSVILGSISAYFIKSYCIMCIVSYGLNFALMFYTWLVRRRFDGDGLLLSLKKDLFYLLDNSRKCILVFVPLMLVWGLTWAAVPDYWRFDPPEVSVRTHTGVTADGHPWIGAREPVLEIVEFTDYQCFQCKKMHYALRRMINKYPDKIRLVHRHFPMDNKVNPLLKETFHSAAGLLALFAIYATAEGKFWPMNDQLFELAQKGKDIDTRALAKNVGVNPVKMMTAVRDIKLHLILRKDILAGLKLGITATPTYVVDGAVYKGWLPADVIARMTE